MPGRRLNITWVKAHTTAQDVVAGRTTELDRCGNDAADALASAAAKLHEAPHELITAANRRKGHAVSMHRLACAILKQRSVDLEELVQVVDFSNPGVADPG